LIIGVADKLFHQFFFLLVVSKLVDPGNNHQNSRVIIDILNTVGICYNFKFFQLG
jgi:hypothetical protein